ncbi:hypothetical protein HPB50_009282 [Hyalomma asiaticum]|uniref:Uncharacterized protein n=1 Tax=Hyalomma asiaticum TaxID=266040 RepID=A0ACB7TET9_HYAAI|nr:hypothetical protein HPB50_009282 [Hyalomma asiaticum]
MDAAKSRVVVSGRRSSLSSLPCMREGAVESPSEIAVLSPCADEWLEDVGVYPQGRPRMSPTVAHACRAAVANNMCPVPHQETCGYGFSAALARSVGRSPGFKAFFSSWNLRLTPVRARAASMIVTARRRAINLSPACGSL